MIHHVRAKHRFPMLRTNAARTYFYTYTYACIIPFCICRKHSQLVLAELIRQHRIDPLPILDAKFCMQELRRLGVPLPERGPYDDDPKYKEKCAQVRIVLMHQ